MSAAQYVPNPTPSVKAIHSQLPIPQPPQWSGYWTFVTALILFMFVLYVAEKGTLSTWLGFFAWTTPAPVGSASSSPGAAVTQAVTGAASQAGLLATGNIGGALYNALITTPNNLIQSINPFK